MLFVKPCSFIWPIRPGDLPRQGPGCRLFPYWEYRPPVPGWCAPPTGLYTGGVRWDEHTPPTYLITWGPAWGKCVLTEAQQGEMNFYLGPKGGDLLLLGSNLGEWCSYFGVSWLCDSIMSDQIQNTCMFLFYTAFKKGVDYHQNVLYF